MNYKIDIATKNFKGTLRIVDVCTKQIIAKKQKCKINGSFIFSEDDKLLYSNGGAYFPITIHENDYPHRIFLSPDGKWILLDYFMSVILMKRENYEIKYCLFSYKGRTAQDMGGVDSKHFGIHGVMQHIFRKLLSKEQIFTVHKLHTYIDIIELLLKI